VSEEASASTVAAIATRSVDVAAIERELDQLLFDPLAESGEEQAIGVRACMSNLVIWAPTRADADRIANDVAAIAERHPSRIIVLVGESRERDLAAYVSAICHLAGGGRQVCSEHVVVEAAGAATRRLPSIARSLVVGDLPTALWWTAPASPATGGDVFRQLAAMADHVIYDSAAWPDDRAVTQSAEWASATGAGVGLSDLAWTRIRPWRTLIARALDPSCAAGALASLREVTIEHGPGSTIPVLLLVGWLADRLGWKQPARAGASGATTWTFAGPRGPVRATARRAADATVNPQRIEVAWGGADAPAGRRALRALDGGRLAILDERGEPRRVVATPDRDVAELVARELPELGRDPLYRRALDVARSLVAGAHA